MSEQQRSSLLKLGWMAVLLLCTALHGQSASAATEEVMFKSEGEALSGTLHFPDKVDPAAAIVLVHGSARADSLRMTALATQLARDGFAVLTYDKRGTGKSGGEFQGGDAAAFTLLGKDAAAAMSAMDRHPRLKEVPIGMIGISQGGWVAPIAAREWPRTAFMVLWSGPVSTLGEELHFSALARHIPAFSMHAHAAQVREHMRSVPERAEDFDPLPVLSRLSLPALWIFGGRDNSIPVELSIARLERLIQDRHPAFGYRVFPEGGHSLDYPGKVPEAYEFMIGWIKGRAAAAADSM